MRYLLLCIMLALSTACGPAEDSAEPTGTVEAPLVVGCKIEINQIDWVVDSSTTGHTVYQLKNVGNQACPSYRVQSVVTKNGVAIGGPVRGPYALDPGPSVSPTRSDNFNVATAPAGSCYFSIWAKYRKGLDLTVKWHDLIPATPGHPSGLLCE